MKPLTLKLGRGWHARLGPMLLSHHRPCGGDPLVQDCSTQLVERDTDTDALMAVLAFPGWALRRPGVAVGFLASSRSGHLAQRLIIRRRTTREHARTRAYGPGGPVTEQAYYADLGAVPPCSSDRCMPGASGCTPGTVPITLGSRACPDVAGRDL